MAGTGEARTLVLAVDQGTSSSRVLIFDSSSSELLTYHQTEIEQIYPQEGWVEEDPYVILNSVTVCIDKAVANLKGLDIDPKNIKAVGVTNQRETLVVWDKQTGKPLYNAIIWLDSRNAETCEQLIQKTPSKSKDYLRERCGLPLSTYFTAVKMRWLMDNNKSVIKAIEEDRCMMGTVDSWLVWNLTGGTGGGVHVTDVTNASRTMLMNIHELKWDETLCKFFDIPQKVLPTIRSSSEVYGKLKGTCIAGVPIAGILGDQQAALVGQACFKMGQAKNTYGTGCFLLYNTGPEAVVSEHGLLTTVAYKFGDKPVSYALEGSVAIAGAAVRWLRDNLGIIKSSDEIEKLASSVESTGGCYFVPAFSGLFCPYWQPSARGVICGLSQYTTKAHIARACLEATCFQTREVLEAMHKDSGISIRSLQVDGGMTANSLLMQLQSDITGISVVRPSMPETTALGAAMAAGAALGMWRLEDEQDAAPPPTADTFSPSVTELERDRRYEMWREAVKRSMDWEKPTEGANLPCADLYVSMPGGFFMLLSVATVLFAEWIRYR